MAVRPTQAVFRRMQPETIVASVARLRYHMGVSNGHVTHGMGSDFKREVMWCTGICPSYNWPI